MQGELDRYFRATEANVTGIARNEVGVPASIGCSASVSGFATGGAIAAAVATPRFRFAIVAVFDPS